MLNNIIGKPHRFLNHVKFWAEKIADPQIFLILFLSLPVIGPLLQPGYFWGGHDARHSVYFLYEFDRAIQDGVWYPRWSPDFAFGYGYPFFNIYGPLSSYLGEAFHLSGFDIVTSVKLVFGLSALLSGMTMYLFARRLMGTDAGLIAALTYVYIPYHLFDLYVRAALAESVGFIFLPLALWGFYEAMTAPRLVALLGGALAYALLMFTSNLLALLFTPILGLYVLYDLGLTIYENPNAKTLKNKLLSPAFVLILGLGLSAIFWLPALLEYRFVRVDQWVGGRFAFGKDFVELFQLFSPRWGFGTSIPGPDDQLGFQLGLTATVLFIFSFIAVPKLSHLPLRHTMYFFQVVTLVVIFLMVPLSYPVWKALPLSNFAQFPWRLLVVVAPFISLLAGTIVAVENKSVPTSYQVVVLASLIILSSYPYIQAEVREPKPTEGPISQAALFRFQQSSDEMTGQTAWTQEIPNWSTLAEQVIRGGKITTKVNYTALPTDNSVGVYSMEMDSVHELLWVGANKDGQTVTFFIPYYPGWQAYIYEDMGPHNGNLDKAVGAVTRVGPLVEQPTIHTTPREGWLVVSIPKGSHFLEIRFQDTIVRTVGHWISILSILGFIILLILKKTVRQAVCLLI